MKLYKVKDIKKFMGLLFASSFFDEYYLREGMIRTFVDYNIDGTYHKDFFKNDDTVEQHEQKFALWSQLRPLCTSLIKGHNTPLSIKFVFGIEPEKLAAIDNDGSIASLLITIKFDENGISLTSAINKSIFTMDRSTDESWDSYVEKMLISAGLGIDSDEN
ncbi:MAG: DUF5721 family protein [Lachnospiraceae bacterium]|nr:DUF5721 family protein [Lachnospiraceae bacterium]